MKSEGEFNANCLANFVLFFFDPVKFAWKVGLSLCLYSPPLLLLKFSRNKTSMMLEV